MRKRVSRPPRFAAVDNNAIDSLPSILSVGLLTTLIRAKDGEDVTVESLTEEYDEGEKALSKAMRTLVERANVVKFKIQRAASEMVIDGDGKKVVKRGGSWYTTFTVDSIPFTREDVADMLADITDAGNVKAVRVEPTHLDPRKQTTAPPKPARPTHPKGGVGPTCENAASGEGFEGQNPENSGPRPTPPSVAPGRPTPGQGGALYRSKTSSLSDSAAEPDGEREEASKDEPPEVDVRAVLDAYADAIGRPVINGTRRQLTEQAIELVAAGMPVWWLADRAREIAARGWTDLAKHCERSTVPTQRKDPSGAVPWCKECDGPNTRMRYTADYQLEQCPACNPVALAAARRAAGDRP
ncbi:hypothetical protein [Streptomyces sp. ME19-01-6]|uniref:hypothetical protein n=1 Tax=Streptomyces sp. ME19-01-6 TaxID=3028686 RepID=UPI0029B9A0FF|nr:hypothetical protein [Streptomyces sp. ME19-01-6]MDX3232859.1 hypothetical protein [Streptomyces sp. ME19-01-6]